MIKMKKGEVIVLGLSELNIEHLKEGKPIRFPAKDIGLPGDEVFYIVYGVTEKAIADDLEIPEHMRSRQ